jgi:glycosyltransferase involved in cell wall biosynthesis
MAVHNMTTLSNVHLLGEGPMRPVLEKLAATSHTPVTLHGWMDNRSEAYKNLLESAAIYCLVSSRENASVSILEAMASGCAIITSDDSGCPELVADAGLKVPFGKPEEIKQAITTLQNNQELRSSLSQKALARVHLHYDWNIIVPKYLQLLHNASSKRHK